METIIILRRVYLFLKIFGSTVPLMIKHPFNISKRKY